MQANQIKIYEYHKRMNKLRLFWQDKKNPEFKRAKALELFMRLKLRVGNLRELTEKN